MKVSYGSPGHHGVTHLMAVGADELEQTAADLTLRRGMQAAGVLAAVGLLFAAPRATAAGLGALVAFGVARRATGAYGGMVKVTV